MTLRSASRLHRGRHRRPQLLRGPRDRPGGRDGRAKPRARPDRRLRAAQRDRGLRDRRADDRRGDPPELGLPRRARPHRRRADVLRHRRRAGVVTTALSVAFLALAAGSILYVVIELLGVCQRIASKESALGAVRRARARLRDRLRARRRRRLIRSPGLGSAGAGVRLSARPTRALARPFTYEVPDGVGRGAVVAVRFGRAARAASSSRRRRGAGRDARPRRSSASSSAAAGARRSRAVARRLLRLDARAGARARRAGQRRGAASGASRRPRGAAAAREKPPS